MLRLMRRELETGPKCYRASSRPYRREGELKPMSSLYPYHSGGRGRRTSGSILIFDPFGDLYGELG